MRTFQMYRGNDETGVSGTGFILEGAMFTNGRVVARWLTAPSSTVIYDSFDDLWNIHIAPHPSNQTEIHFDDGEIVTVENRKALVVA